MSILQKYVEACSVTVCGIYGNHCALKVSIVQVNAFLILRAVASWERKNDLMGKKNCSRVMSWNQLAQVGISDSV